MTAVAVPLRRRYPWGRSRYSGWISLRTGVDGPQGHCVRPRVNRQIVTVTGQPSGTRGFADTFNSSKLHACASLLSYSCSHHIMGTYAALWARLLPFPSTPAAAPTPWATVRPSPRMQTLTHQSGGCRRRRRRRRRNSPPTWRAAAADGVLPAAGGRLRQQRVGRLRRLRVGGRTGGGDTPLQRQQGFRCSAAAIRRRHCEVAAAPTPPPRPASGSCG